MVKNFPPKILLNGNKIISIQIRHSTVFLGYKNVFTIGFHYAIIEKSFINLDLKKNPVYVFLLSQRLFVEVDVFLDFL